jgi:hypothetical protein
MSLDRETDINVKLQISTNMWYNQKVFAGKVRKDTLLRFYKIMAIPTLLYGLECWTLTRRQKSRLKAAKMRFQRSVAV